MIGMALLDRGVVPDPPDDVYGISRSQRVLQGHRRDRRLLDCHRFPVSLQDRGGLQSFSRLTVFAHEAMVVS